MFHNEGMAKMIEAIKAAGLRHVSTNDGVSHYTGTWVSVVIYADGWEIATKMQAYSGTDAHEFAVKLKELNQKAKRNMAARARHAAYTSVGMKRTPYGYE